MNLAFLDRKIGGLEGEKERENGGFTAVMEILQNWAVTVANFEGPWGPKEGLMMIQ